MCAARNEIMLIKGSLEKAIGSDIPVRKCSLLATVLILIFCVDPI
jgi:hypothetical protein